MTSQAVCSQTTEFRRRVDLASVHRQEEPNNAVLHCSFRFILTMFYIPLVVNLANLKLFSCNLPPDLVFGFMTCLTLLKVQFIRQKFHPTAQVLNASVAHLTATQCLMQLV